MTCEFALILCKLAAHDAEAMASRWEPVCHGGSPPTLTWEDRSIRLSDAQKLLADLNPQVPFYCPLDWIKALAASATVYRQQTETHVCLYVCMYVCMYV